MPKSIQQYELDIAFLTNEIKITKIIQVSRPRNSSTEWTGIWQV